MGGSGAGGASERGWAEIRSPIHAFLYYPVFLLEGRAGISYRHVIPLSRALHAAAAGALRLRSA